MLRVYGRRKDSELQQMYKLTHWRGGEWGWVKNQRFFEREIRCIVDIFWNTSMVNGAVSKKILTRKFPSSKALY